MPILHWPIFINMKIINFVVEEVWDKRDVDHN